MAKSLLALFFLLLTSGISYAQNPKPMIKKQMDRLRFLEGEWKGEGSFSMGPGPAAKAQVAERVRFELDGAIAVVQGLGLSLENPADTVHQAFGVIAYDLQKQQYNLRAYKDGLFTDAEARFLDDGRFEWRMENPYAGLIKYTLGVDDAGQWVETGEVSRDGGKTWMQFLEMKLRKSKE